MNRLCRPAGATGLSRLGVPSKMSRCGLLAALCLSSVSCVVVGKSADALDARGVGHPGYPALSIRWRRVLADHEEETKPQEFASGVQHGRWLYIGSQDGVLYALDTHRRGQVLWSQRLGSLSSRPLVDRGQVFVGTDDGIFYSLNKVDGSVRWKYATQGAILEAPVVSDELVLFTNGADHIYALDRTTGKFRWKYDTDTPEEFTVRGHSGVTLSGDLCFVGFSDGTLVGLRVANGGRGLDQVSEG